MEKTLKNGFSIINSCRVLMPTLLLNLNSFFHFVIGIKWLTLFSGAALGAFSAGFRAVMQAPVKALSEQSFYIRFFSFLSPQRPFNGLWEVRWNVESTRLPKINVDNVRIFRFFSNVSFTTQTTALDGSAERCVFVGKLLDRTLTGRWYNPKDELRGYFGTYQVQLHGSLETARGSWIGWASDGSVQRDDMALKKIR
jgi:hypothetical protein